MSDNFERTRDAVIAAGADVLAFYRDLPFNYRGTAQDHARQIRSIDQFAAYTVLTPHLHKGTTVLDVGCGAGWSSITAAYHYGCHVTGIDFNDVAIERARGTARILGLNIEFEVADLFRYEPKNPYDVAISLGVLHHTYDCHAALHRLCTRYVKRGGYCFVGLYHRYARRPFLEHFRALKTAGASEAKMLSRYRGLHSSLVDETHAISWFRDQVLHPHETQHDLRELMPVLRTAGMSLVATSVNGFARIDDIEALFSAERQLEQVGADRLANGKYYPGFFVILAKRASTRRRVKYGAFRDVACHRPIFDRDRRIFRGRELDFVARFSLLAEPSAFRK